MKTSKTKLLALSFAATLTAQASLANEISPPTIASSHFTLGLVAGFVDKPYEDLDNDDKQIIAPLVIYESERFFWRGATGGWKFVNRPDLEVAVIAALRGTDGYNADDSDFLEGMDDRDGTVDGGFHIRWMPSEFGLKFTMVADLADEYDGYEVRGEGIYEAQAGNWSNQVSAGVIYQSDDLIDYYYGVEGSEARPGRPAYSGDATTNFRLQAVTNYRPEGSKWRYFLGGRYEVLGDEIDDSPITDDDSRFMILAGFAYTWR